jgi:hypothetical protein
LLKIPELKEVMCKGFLMWRGEEMAGAPVPTGYVVTGETSSTVCSRSSKEQNAHNAWKIQQPSGRMSVCKGFPIPRGFVTDGQTVLADCPFQKNGPNAWIIRPR